LLDSYRFFVGVVLEVGFAAVIVTMGFGAVATGFHVTPAAAVITAGV
jgi:hypothetical protein